MTIHRTHRQPRPHLSRPVRLAAALALVCATACAPAGRAVPNVASGARATADAERLRGDIAHLASDRLEGRGTGTPGNDSAAAYVARRFAALGLQAAIAVGDSVPCEGPPAASAASLGLVVAPGESSRCRGFLQRFTARSAAAAHAGRPSRLATQNVVALLPGTDPALRGQFVVLGAHVDHLGRDPQFAMDPRAGDAVRNGADDNASGTAAVLELARLLAADPPRRSVLFVAFSGEELGLLGSQYFVEHPPAPLERMVAMLNFDMVGRLANDRLIVYGVATATELRGIVDQANRGLASGPLTVRAVGDGAGPSDHASFYLKGMPVLHFFTDQHPDYHAATDDVERINAPGAARVVDLAHAVARAIADRPPPLTFVRAASSAPAAGIAGDPGAPRPWLGSVPDMSAEDTIGLRLLSVTPGSPGDSAGLRAGDVVTAIGGARVKDLYSYSAALYAHKPGDRVTIDVVRGGRRERVTVTLGRRGQ
jgi:hypothetical protein